MQRSAVLVAGLCVGSLLSCATNEHEAANFGKRVLVGKSETDVIACAGSPARRMAQGESVTMVYRNESSVLERSFPMAKGTVSCPHHGCEALVMLQDNRVADVEYHSFPEGSGSCDHCDRIFVACGGP